MAEDEGGFWTDALAGKTTSEAWRSIAEWANRGAFGEAARGEMPEGADLPPDVSRRDLLKLLGAGMALAGAAGCERESGRAIRPYTLPPPEVTPGIANHYATAMSLDGYATGLVVESHEGRPTKIEGNPEHPASLGATGVFEQASILGLYDPRRARALRGPSGLASFGALVAHFSRDRADRGAGLRFLMEPQSSPLIGDLVRRVRERFPEARFTFHSPVLTNNAAEGARVVFGEPLQPRHDLLRASVILALDADFLSSMPFSTRLARDFAARRRPSSPEASMNRLYVVEAMPTPTGTLADHRIRRRPSEIPAFAASVAAELVLGEGRRPRGATPALDAALAPFRAPPEDRLIRAIARDLAANAGAGVVIAGERQPPIVHALLHLIHAALGGDAAWLTAPVLIDAGEATQDLPSLTDDLRQRRVDTLAILEANPVYTAPRDIEFARALAGVADCLRLGLYEDETARAASWFVPAAHYLESWGDARAYDGTVSLIQPLITPLEGGRTTAEILAIFAGDTFPDARRLLRESWAARRGGGDDFDRFFAEALRRGVIPGTEAPRAAAAPSFYRLIAMLTDLARAPASAPDAIELELLPSPSVYDGRFADNAWLLELPDPITKLTWDNAAMLSPRTAARLGLEDGDVVELAASGRTARGPALIVPGHADNVVSVYLGYGRTGAEELAAGVGFEAHALSTSASPMLAKDLSVRKLDVPRHPLAVTQKHWSVEGRPVAPASTLAEYRKNPEFTAELRGPLPSFLPVHQAPGSQWAMSIDLSICTGCSACVVACQAENNVLVVGKEGVLKSREMHWLRIDTYYRGDPEAPSAVHQPMLCQHCENAPCEYVCPVNATVHSPDGLNEMIYNRCVGTRFCSNNCPYKVRRFNWFNYNHHQPLNQGRISLQRNPDVSVRDRGVMEKCTYCVQRIRRAGLAARIEGRGIRAGEVVTACQEACPTRAIQFDSLENTNSTMAQWRREPRAFAVLHDLNTRPRTQYLAKITNPNPELEGPLP